MKIKPSIKSPWQKPVFVYAILDRTDKEIGFSLLDTLDSSWRVVSISEKTCQVGKIFDSFSLELAESIEDHIQSCFRLLNIAEEETRFDLWVGPWCFDEEAPFLELIGK